MKKVVYIISNINKAIAFEWICEELDRSRFQLSFILINPGPSNLESFLEENGFEVTLVNCRSKTDWPRAIFRVYRLLRIQKPDMVHCHLLQASVIGLLAARMAGIKKRIYTRHHSSQHHVYFPKGVWWDKMTNKLASHIVAVSDVVKKILVDWESVPSQKVWLIPHGFRLESFTGLEPRRITDFKMKYNLGGVFPVIGSISRFIQLKGVQYTIPAFQRLLAEYPGAVLLLMNAQGDYEQEITRQLKLLPENSYRLIKFENDVAAAYNSMDVFVHVPIDAHSEAFGQIYIEALAAQVPSVFTLSGIAPGFIKESRNAFVVPFKNSEAIYYKLDFLLKDYEQSKKVALQGKKDVEAKFSLDKMINALEELYERD